MRQAEGMSFAIARFMEGRNSSVMLRLVSVESQSDQLMTSLPTSHF